MNTPEKPKRAEKPKNDTASKRGFLLKLAVGMAVPGVIVLVGIGLYIRDNMRACGCGDAYMTDVAIQTENAQVAAQLTDIHQTAVPMAETAIAGAMTETADAATGGVSLASVPLTATALAHVYESMTPATPTVTLTPFNTATGVAQSMATLTAQPTRCSMFWTSDESPEGTQKVQSALNDAGISGVAASLVIDSERDGCHVDAQGTAYPLSALPRLNLYIETDDPDTAMLAIEAVLNTLDPRQYSYMLVDFTLGTDTRVHQIPYSAALDALKDGTLREKFFGQS